MTPQPQTDRSATYVPESQDRRRGDDDARPWWRAWVKPTEIIAGVALLLGTLAVLGFRHESPAAAIVAESAMRAKSDTAITRTVDSLGRRADRTDSTLVKLTDRLTFMNYLQCVQAKDSPTPLAPKARTDCDTIIQRRLAP